MGLITNTKLENFSTSNTFSFEINNWDKSKNYPLCGKIASRTIGPLAVFLSSVIDALAHTIFALIKLPVAILLSPYQFLAIHFFPGKQLPHDLELQSVGIHIFRSLESVFFAASLPLITLFNPEKAYSLTNWRNTFEKIKDLQQEIHKKEELINKKNEQIFILEKVNQATVQLQQLNEKMIAKKQGVIKKLRARLNNDELKQQKKKLESAELNDTLVINLKKELAVTQRARENIIIEKVHLTQQLENLEKENKKLLLNDAQFKDKIQLATHENEKLIGEIKELNEKLESNRTNLNLYNEQISHLKTELKDKDNVIQERNKLSLENKKLEEKLTKLPNKYIAEAAAEKRELNNLKKEARNLSEKLDLVQKERDSQVDNIEKLKNELGDRDKVIQEKNLLLEENRILKEKVEISPAKFTAIETAAAKFERDLIKNEMNELNQQIIKLKGELTLHMQVIADKEQQIQDQTQQFNTLSEENNRYKKLHQQLDELQKNPIKELEKKQSPENIEIIPENPPEHLEFIKVDVLENSSEDPLKVKIVHEEYDSIVSEEIFEKIN